MATTRRAPGSTGDPQWEGCEMFGALRRSTLILVTLALLACAWLLPQPVRAALTVTTCADSGTGSLRDAIGAAGSGDTIGFTAGLSCTITLTSGTLEINTNLTIDATGATIA